MFEIQMLEKACCHAQTLKCAVRRRRGRRRKRRHHRGAVSEALSGTTVPPGGKWLNFA